MKCSPPPETAIYALYRDYIETPLKNRKHLRSTANNKTPLPATPGETKQYNR